MQSLNYLLKTIKETAESHKQVNTYAQGQKYDIGASEAILYPLIWSIPTGVNPNFNGNTMDYKIQILCMDIDKTDGSNEIDILSDSILILIDIIAKLKDLIEDENEISIASIGSFEPFTDALNDTVTGHSCEIIFSAFFAGDVCNEIFNN